MSLKNKTKVLSAAAMLCFAGTTSDVNTWCFIAGCYFCVVLFIELVWEL